MPMDYSGTEKIESLLYRKSQLIFWQNDNIQPFIYLFPFCTWCIQTHSDVRYEANDKYAYINIQYISECIYIYVCEYCVLCVYFVLYMFIMYYRYVYVCSIRAIRTAAGNVPRAHQNRISLDLKLHFATQNEISIQRNWHTFVVYLSRGFIASNSGRQR